MMWLMDGDIYVVVDTGQPSDPVEIGVGRDITEAILAMEATPIQSAGRDPVGTALRWAHFAGWIETPYLRPCQL